MKVDDSEVSGPNAYVSVESLNDVPGKLRGVTHVFARQVATVFPIVILLCEINQPRVSLKAPLRVQYVRKMLSILLSPLLRSHVRATHYTHNQRLVSKYRGESTAAPVGPNMPTVGVTLHHAHTETKRRKRSRVEESEPERFTETYGLRLGCDARLALDISTTYPQERQVKSCPLHTTNSQCCTTAARAWLHLLVRTYQGAAPHPHRAFKT